MSEQETQTTDLEQELPDEGQDLEEGQDEGETPPADAGSDTPSDQEQPAEGLKPEAEHLKDQVKKYINKHSVAKKEADIGRQTLRELEAEGLLDRDEAAKKRNMSREQFDAYLDHKDAPEPGEDGHAELRDKRIDEDFSNPSVQKALTRAYGTVEQQTELAQAFNYALSADPQLQERYANVAPEDAIYMVLDTGKEFLEDFREAKKTGGTPKALMAELRKLREENAALKAGGKTTLTEEMPEETTAQKHIETDPLKARDARLRALSR